MKYGYWLIWLKKKILKTIVNVAACIRIHSSSSFYVADNKQTPKCAEYQFESQQIYKQSSDIGEVMWKSIYSNNNKNNK